MRKPDHVLIGVHIHDRLKQAPPLQKVLSRHGCLIKTRIGLHEASGELCSPSGIVLLETVGGRAAAGALVRDLSALEGVTVKKMVFPHQAARGAAERREDCA